MEYGAKEDGLFISLVLLSLGCDWSQRPDLVSDPVSNLVKGFSARMYLRS
jgi:hypothetical protein